MRKAITGMVAIAVLVMLFLTSVPRASATKPILTISDTVSAVATTTCESVGNGEIKCDFTSDQQWVGDWTGRIVIVGHWVIHHDTLVTVNGMATFEGTVLGRSGTVTMNAITIWWPTKQIEGGAIHSGTGDLAGIRGHMASAEGFYNPTARLYTWVHFE